MRAIIICFLLLIAVPVVAQDASPTVPSCSDTDLVFAIGALNNTKFFKQYQVIVDEVNGATAANGGLNDALVDISKLDENWQDAVSKFPNCILLNVLRESTNNLLRNMSQMIAFAQLTILDTKHARPALQERYEYHLKQWQTDQQLFAAVVKLVLGGNEQATPEATP